MIECHESFLHDCSLPVGLRITGNFGLEATLINRLALQRPCTLARVIVKSGVSAFESGGDLFSCFHLDSIFEFAPPNDLRQVVKPA
jgi:hypothetical protein